MGTILVMRVVEPWQREGHATRSRQKAYFSVIWRQHGGSRAFVVHRTIVLRPDSWRTSESPMSVAAHIARDLPKKSHAKKYGKNVKKIPEPRSNCPNTGHSPGHVYPRPGYRLKYRSRNSMPASVR
jgi:hypothetical protein